MYFLLTSLALLLVALTLIPLSHSRRWYVRAMDFPRVQIACLSLLWLLIYGVTELRSSPTLMAGAVAVLAALFYQLRWILPSTQIHDVEILTHLRSSQVSIGSIRLLSCNVLMHNRNSEALIKLILTHKPDILITLESDQWWQDKLDSLTDYPHRIACPLDNLYGMHVYSQLPLSNTTVEYLVEPDKPSMQACVTLQSGHALQLHIAHPAPPAPGENEESIERDVELIMIAKAVANQVEPLIVVGDLNDVSWSATTRLFREISGLKDPRIGRGLFNTFNAHHWLIRWPLDHVFVSDHFELVSLKRLDNIGSDHFPLLVELALVKKTIVPGINTQTPTEPALLETITESEQAQ